MMRLVIFNNKTYDNNKSIMFMDKRQADLEEDQLSSQAQQNKLNPY